MPRGRNYSDDSRSSDVSWRSYTQNSWEEEVKKIRNSKRWLNRRDETKYKKQRPKKKKGEKKSRKKKSRSRKRNSTSSASPTTSAESDGRNARSAGRSHTNDRGRSQSKFREESKNVFEERKERLKRKEEEAIRREFKKRRGYNYSDDESSSDSDSEYDDSYSTSGSESQDRRDKSRTAGGDEPKLRRFDTQNHRATSDSEEAGAGNRTPDRRRKESDSSESDSREANPFMRLSQLQRQRDEADPYRVGYRDDAYYQTDKNERADAEDFLTNRRRIGDAEYYRNTEQDANRYNIHKEAPAAGVCNCVIS